MTGSVRAEGKKYTYLIEQNILSRQKVNPRYIGNLCILIIIAVNYAGFITLYEGIKMSEGIRMYEIKVNEEL